MSLPSQEVLDDIKELISEITGFQENDENFLICERYCLSHVVHHTYPFVNKTTVLNLINSYVSRFYGHGYFAVSQELNNQITNFLSNSKLFEKNPQYDIQWCLLSLLTSLSSNLTSLKKLPELLPTDDEENEKDDFEWKEYLLSDLPNQKSSDLNSDNEDFSRDSDLSEEEYKENTKFSQGNLTNEKEQQKKKDMKVLFDNKIAFSKKFADERKKRFEDFLIMKMEKKDIENDYLLRKNISEKFDSLMLEEGIVRKSQLISEFELMEYLLFQFQTGERILLRKGFTNPSLTSLTQETLGSYLEALQPYFKIIRSFNDFDAEVAEARYPYQREQYVDWSAKSNVMSPANSSPESIKISNVLYTYNMMLKRAKEPFHSKVREISENLCSYTLLQMENELKPYYFDLMSLYSIHSLAIKNWKGDPTCISSIRILSVLYKAIMDATSIKMSFLYLNLFLHCFQVYLDVIDSWISFVDLIDPYEEFLVAKSVGAEKSENKCSEYEIRPYKNEIENFGEIFIIDFIAQKMIHVGQSLEVLRRLNRYVMQETPEQSSFHLLLKAIDKKVRSLERAESEEKEVKPKEKKKKSIFTLSNSYISLERDSGGGDSLTGNFLMEVLKEEKENDKKKKEQCHPKKSEKSRKSNNYYEELINSVVKNSFFKMAFDTIGMKEVQKKMEEAKKRADEEELMLIREPKGKIRGIYPFHKIITEAVQLILENRVSGACSLVKEIVIKECSLLTHLSLFRSIFLLRDSYLIQPFILALFNQPEIWGNSYSLSLHLKECVRTVYKHHANALSVILTKGRSTKCQNILQVIDVITVNYDVKWPLTLILTPEAIRKYNEIFRLSLKLKWAHWALCNVHFDGEYECSSKSTCHRLRLLRFWLLSTLGRVHNYFLTEMAPFDLKLNSCENLKDIIDGHSEFLEKMHHNFLLGDNSSEERKLITETLIPLCMELLLESANVKETKLSSIEKTFKSCHLRLTSLLAISKK